MQAALSIRDLLTTRLGTPFTPLFNRSLSQVGTSAVTALVNDPSRVSWLIINLSLNVVYLAPIQAPTSARGIRLDPNGGNFAMIWEEDGELVAYEWQAIADGAASSVFIVENVIAPRG